MAEMAKYTVENELGCGLMGGIFQWRSLWSRKTSVRSLPTNHSYNTFKEPRTPNSRGWLSGCGETAIIDSSNTAEHPPKLDEKPITKATLVSPRPSTSRQQNQGLRTSDTTRSSTSSSNSSSLTKVSQTQDSAYGRRLRRDPTGNSGELNRMITDHQQSSGSRTLVRPSSSNVMMLGHLGNLRQPVTGNLLTNNLPNCTIKALDYLPRSVQETSSNIPYHKNSNGKIGGIMGNIVRKKPNDGNQQSGNRFRGLMNRLDPEVLKSMGNEEYKLGRFEEALVLYNRAIALDSNKASYRSNKSAALTGLGRLIEAVFECSEAIRIEPTYHGAHHRLATLYLRLGEAEKAMYHYKRSGPKADSKEIAQVQALQAHLSRCSEAWKLRDWNTLLKESRCAISSGADSAPQIYALQAEALLKLHRHQEAEATFRRAPNFDIDSCTQLFGPADCGYLLIVGAQVYMVTGRFEDAMAAAQHAARLDSSNEEVNTVVRRTRAVASARLSGNQLFKASKFSEACVVYSEGLEHDPYNSVLLCNRAACRSNLHQFEKAVEDCTAALTVRPSYCKARLRRANCNAKLERWEASIQDYEMLIRETPGDEEVGRALFEAQVQLKKQRGEDIEDMKFGPNLVLVSSNERFRHFVTSPGMSVVLFCNKTSHEQVLQLMEQICMRYPSVNFLKVEVEDHPYLTKSERVSFIPAFKIYKNGSRVKEIPGNNRELLESSVKLYSS